MDSNSILYTDGVKCLIFPEAQFVILRWSLRATKKWGGKLFNPEEYILFYAHIFQIIHDCQNDSQQDTKLSSNVTRIFLISILFSTHIISGSFLSLIRLRTDEQEQERTKEEKIHYIKKYVFQKLFSHKIDFYINVLFITNPRTNSENSFI